MDGEKGPSTFLKDNSETRRKLGGGVDTWKSVH